jgi:ATP-dependent helicase/nuclease subunit A
LRPIFSIYRSSAGSGKTRTLAREYLRLALKHRSHYFRHILAVTFTNKASQEMKDRILHYLDEFANGRPNELAAELMQELGMDEQTFRQNSQATQQEILHHYTQFSISTIDAFFQKVIRSFTREAGIVGDYRLEVEQDAVLEEVIDNLIDELGNNKELTDWVVDFAKENLENERAWDIRQSLVEFAREIFREEFREIEDEVNGTTAGKNFFRNLKDTLWKTKMAFLQSVSKPAQEALEIIRQHQWTIDDFYYGKNSGLFTFFRTFATSKSADKLRAGPGKLIRSSFVDGQKWPNKNSRHFREIQRVATERLAPIVSEILERYDSSFTKALSAEVALKNLYVFGLISDISRKLKEFKDENNLMLLADAPKFLNGVIQDSDTPFIYEKVGSFYKNYLIDEFQDTSGMQWKNFQPLIVNSLDQGNTSLVVGDVKQAIYRWRGGDLNLLQKNITNLVGSDRTEIIELASNFRSSPEIVHFNNLFFATASSLIANITGATIPESAYSDVTQKAVRTEPGFVRIELIKDTEPTNGAQADEPEPFSIVRWKDISLQRLPLLLEQLQEKGAALKDIAILVRKNDEGQRIATHLLQYKNSVQARKDCRYDVVSNESLRIDGAATVNLLLGAMRYLLNGEDSIARAQLGYEYARLHEPHRILSEVFSVTNQTTFENNLPPAFTKEKVFLKKLALLELTETLIRIFDLGSIQGEIVYLQAFQDLVLDFCNRERNDLGSFLDWWESNKHKKSIQISGEVDAIQILTVHKSKGLQFPYVIIPFCSWPLDHETWQSPNLWVRSEEAPFGEAGFLPVRYAGNVDETSFQEYYREERTRCYLDNLNLLYVSLTRAIQGLMVIAPSPMVRGAKESVAGLLYNTIQHNEELRERWNETDLTWSSGEWNITPQNRKINSSGISIEKYISDNWLDKLVIKKTGTNYFNADETDERFKINYGIQMHAVLSRIQNANEIPETLAQLMDDGFISVPESEDIRIELNQLLRISQVAEWFDGSWVAKTEVPILVPGGEQRRIDRLLLKGKAAVVIDFKTGKPNKADQQQVKEYMEIMREMNFTDVKGYLVYLQGKTLVEVRLEGKQRLVKKLADKDQLSLGF